MASRTDTIEEHALWQPAGAKEDNRFCEGDRHLRLVKRRQRRRTVIKNITNSLYCELRLHLISPPTLQTEGWKERGMRLKERERRKELQ